MYSAMVIEAFGPFCGRGGFGSCTGKALSRSPKKAIQIAIQRMIEDSNSQTRNGGHIGGGVPIFDEVKLYKNGQLILIEGLNRVLTSKYQA